MRCLPISDLVVEVLAAKDVKTGVEHGGAKVSTSRQELKSRNLRIMLADQACKIVLESGSEFALLLRIAVKSSECRNESKEA